MVTDARGSRAARVNHVAPGKGTVQHSNDTDDRTTRVRQSQTASYIVRCRMQWTVDTLAAEHNGTNDWSSAVVSGGASGR